jgi:hypothetical protein
VLFERDRAHPDSLLARELVCEAGAEAAVDVPDSTGHVARGWGGEERHDLPDLFGCADPAERVDLVEPGPRGVGVGATVVEVFDRGCADESWADCVDADPLRCEVEREKRGTVTSAFPPGFLMTAIMVLAAGWSAGSPFGPAMDADGINEQQRLREMIAAAIERLSTPAPDDT